MTTKHSLIIIACVLLVAVFGFTAGLKQAKINQLRTNTIASDKCPDADLMQDYQLQYYMDTLWVYQGERLVGMNIDSVHGDGYVHGSFIDSLIMADNL